MSLRTNILFFTRTSDAEVRHRKLLPDARQNRQAVNAMISWVRAEVQHAGIPVMELNEHAQIGASFGERLTNGVKSLFQDGADQVIIIGNDSPGITSSDLTETREHLDRGIQVIGRSQNGGSWMIGLRREQFDAEAFMQLPWQTRSLGESLEQLLKSQGNTLRLRDLKEIQNQRSLQGFLRSNEAEGFARMILDILRKANPLSRDQQLIHLTDLLIRPSLRAPPMAA